VDGGSMMILGVSRIRLVTAAPAPGGRLGAGARSPGDDGGAVRAHRTAPARQARLQLR